LDFRFWILDSDQIGAQIEKSVRDFPLESEFAFQLLNKTQITNRERFRPLKN